MDEARRWEVYSQILASDNVTLSYSSTAATASFDIISKHVILPTWDCLDETSTQALASHEIGHAKFSTYTRESFKEMFDRYKDLFNVVEDARIERLMKREFKGLKDIFQDGYSTIAKGGVFPLENVESASLIERLNIFTKFGFMMDVPFYTKEEAEFSFRIMNLATKTDVVDLCEDILDYLKEHGSNLQEQSFESLRLGEHSYSSGEIKEEEGSRSVGDKEASEAKASKASSDRKKCTQNANDSQNAGDDRENDSASNENEKEDAQSSNNGVDDKEDDSGKLDELLKDHRTREFVKNIEKIFRTEKEKAEKNVVVINSPEILNECYIDLSKAVARHDQVRISKNDLNIIEKSATVAAAKFFQKKSALENNARRKMNVGRVDPKRLAKYSVSDAIFKTVEKSPQGRNHGIVLLLDFSVSMNLIKDVQRCACIQAAILGRFCQMTGIPFSIISFGCGTEYGWHHCNYSNPKLVAKLADSNNFDPKLFVRMAKLGKDRAKGILLENPDGSKYQISLGDGTPTLEALLAARNEIKAMRRNGVEKVAVLVSTDGGFSRRIKGCCSYVDVDYMRQLILDGKSFSVKDLDGLHQERSNNVIDWAFELFAGYLKKETGASFIYSFIGSNSSFQHNFDRWKFIEDEYVNRHIVHHAYACEEPYLFRRAYTIGRSVAQVKAENERIFTSPCHSIHFQNDNLFDRFLTMNSSYIEKCSATKKTFEGADDEEIVNRLSSSNKMLNAFKMFANAFVDFFS